MIDPTSGVEAFLQPCALQLPYQEYAVKHGSPLYVDGRNTTYVEAIPKERYSMGVTLPRGFHTVSNAGVRITFTLHISDLERVTISEVKAAGASTLRTDAFIATYPGSSGYRTCGFRFANGGSSISAQNDADKLNTRVDVEIVPGQLSTHLATPIKLSHRALGDSLVDIGRASHLPFTRGLVVTDDAVAGAVKFTFYCVSHEFLKRQRVIPRNQTPKQPFHRSIPKANVQTSMESFLTPGYQPKRRACPIDMNDRCTDQDDDEDLPTGRVKVEPDDEDHRASLLPESSSRNSIHEGSLTTPMHSKPRRENAIRSHSADMVHDASQSGTGRATQIKRVKKQRRG